VFVKFTYSVIGHVKRQLLKSSSNDYIYFLIYFIERVFGVCFLLVTFTRDTRVYEMIYSLENQFVIKGCVVDITHNSC